MTKIEWLMVVVAIVILMITFATWPNLPVVYRANPSGECVRVEPGSCDNIPRRYHEVWVDPDLR